MSNIPTAEEMALKWEYANMNAMGTEKQGSKELSIAAFMIEFAKLHCEAQLKAILEKADTKLEKGVMDEYRVVDKDSIINAYGLNQIK